MTVTKSYVARNYGVRDRIIDNLGVVAAVLVVGFVLLFISGAMDFGRDHQREDRPGFDAGFGAIAQPAVQGW